MNVKQACGLCWLAGLLTAVAFVGLMGLIALMIPASHAAEPHVTMEPGDQKGNMGLYDDARGPPWSNIPIVGSVNMPWGNCLKPGVELTKDKYGNSIFAEDNDVIWRCMQTHPTGQPADAPPIYCIIQNMLVRADEAHPRQWACYHDYVVIWKTYVHHYGKWPLILEDEIPFVTEANRP